MLYERKQLNELHYMKHFHDSRRDYNKYDEFILDKSLSSYIYNNNSIFGFLKRLQPLVSIMIDQMNVMKNFKNYIVDKYYYKH